MNCWDCKKVIVVPGRIIPEGAKYSQTFCVDVACNCGASYTITTVRRMKRTRVVQVDRRTDSERLRDIQWKNQD